MKKLIILTLVFLSSVDVNAQNCIGLNKKQCYEAVSQDVHKNNYKSFSNENDSSIAFAISRNAKLYVTLTVNFDRSAICTSQVYTFTCDTCEYFAYQKLIHDSKYKWQKREQGIYYSKTSGGIIFDTPPDAILSYRIRKQ